MTRQSRFKFGTLTVALLMTIVIAGSAHAQRSSTPQTVNAQQAGPWTVGVDPANNTVRLPNTDADPLPVKIAASGPARKAFQSRVVVNIAAGSGVASSQLFIPSGKRMVIENVSAIARVPQGLYPFIQFLTYFDSGDTVFDAQDIAYHRVALAEQGNFNGNIWSTANHKVLVFSDERVINHSNLGLTVSFGVSAIVAQQVTAEVTFSGYLEDLPTTP